MFAFMATPEWAEYLRTHGYEANGTYVEDIKCEICGEDLTDDVHVIIEPPPGLIARRKFHGPCLVSHLLAHLDDPDDELSNYLSKKPVSS